VRRLVLPIAVLVGAFYLTTAVESVFIHYAETWDGE
jgi:hypothetical protein